MAVFVLRLNQPDIDFLQELQVEAAATGESKAGGRIKSLRALAIDAKRGKTKWGQTFERYAESWTKGNGIEGVDIPKMGAGLDYAADPPVKPIRRCNGKTTRNTLISIDCTVRTEVGVAGENVDFRRLVVAGWCRS